jgi:hypothetical protein
MNDPPPPEYFLTDPYRAFTEIYNKRKNAHATQGHLVVFALILDPTLVTKILAYTPL